MEKVNHSIGLIVDEIENFLGKSSSLIDTVLIDDENDIFPTEAKKWLDNGILNYVAMEKYGGKFSDLSQLFWLSRLVAKRNLTSAIALGQTFLGTLPVYISGSDFLKELASTRLKEHGLSCLALTEEDHGSDIASTETFYNQEKLTGKKWCINNATIGKTQSVIVQTNNGLCFLFIDKKSLDSNNYTNIEKIKTHGIKGADISGINFNQLNVDSKYIIGRQGKGVDILQKTMQVSRTFCTTFSIGSLEASLKEAYKFSQKRILYGKPIYEMEIIQNQIKKSYLTLLISEAIGILTTRFITSSPTVMSLYSAVSKYLIPHIVTNSIESICEVVGAKAYLRENDYAILEKYRRDHKVVSIFDGSSSVNLSIIARQFKNIKKHLEAKPTDQYENNFELQTPWEPFTGTGLILSNRSNDIVFSTYYNLQNKIDKKILSIIDTNLIKLKKDIEHFNEDITTTHAQKIAAHYCKCLSACMYVLFFIINQNNIKHSINDTLLRQIIYLIFDHNIKYDDISLDIINNKLISHWDLNSLES